MAQFKAGQPVVVTYPTSPYKGKVGWVASLTKAGGYNVALVGGGPTHPFQATSIRAALASAVGTAITKDAQSLVVRGVVYELRTGVVYGNGKTVAYTAQVAKLEAVRLGDLVTVRQTNQPGLQWDLVAGAWTPVATPGPPSSATGPLLGAAVVSTRLKP